MDAVKFVQEQMFETKSLPQFKAGDTLEVSYKIVEGSKERIQLFKGDVIQIKGQGATKTFTVRKISNGVGVERIFPMFSTSITDIKVIKKGKVRRAKLYYLRNLVGKAARIKEKNTYASKGA